MSAGCYKRLYECVCVRARVYQLVFVGVGVFVCVWERERDRKCHKSSVKKQLTELLEEKAKAGRDRETGSYSKDYTESSFTQN